MAPRFVHRSSFIIHRLMEFTRDDIRRQFDPGTFARGEAYARQDRVVEIDVDGDRIYGAVVGSGSSLYQQTIRVKSDKRGARFSGDCSCPMTYNCKHVVAVLLTELEYGTEGVPAEAEGWLQRLALFQSTLRAARAAVRDASIQLAYVLVPERKSQAPGLYPYMIRLRADGSVAEAVLENEPLRVLALRPPHMSRDDEEPLRLLGAMKLSHMTSIPSGVFGAALLSKLSAEGRLWRAQSLKAAKYGHLERVLPGPARHMAPAWLDDGAGRDTVTLGWRVDDGDPLEHTYPTDPLYYLDGLTVGAVALPAQFAAIQPAAVLDLVAQAPMLRAEQREAVAGRLAELGLDGFIPAPAALHVRERRDVVPVPCLLLDSRQIPVRRDWVWHDVAVLTFDYDGLSTEGVDEPVLRNTHADGVDVIVRDQAAEAAAAARLAALGFAPLPDDALPEEWRGALALPDESAWLAFVRDGLPRLREAGWLVEVDSGFRYVLAEVEAWYADLDEGESDVNGWFDLELGIVVAGERYPLLPLLLEMIRAAPRDFDAAALAGRADDAELLVELSRSTRVALPWGRVKPILATLGELYFSERIGAKIHLPALDAARLAELERAARLRWLGGDRLRELGRKLHDFDGIRPVAVPAGLRAQLRPYQRTGLDWMQFLREYGFGGILADDMGLGKTVQTLAHILAEQEAGRLDAPALVVAPTSLMSNWQAEAARFAPGLRVLLLHGKDRKALFDRIGDADLVLTTYPLLARDEPALRKHRYHLLILDEAQYVKNSRSKAAQTVRLLDARHRLCLTGTPVQNHLGELWSQFHFLMPGLLGEEKQFNAVFRKPIELQGDVLRQDLLARRVKPFMLRRTKDKVATELPSKTEIVLPIELDGAQRDLYETVRVAMDKKVRDAIDSKGLARSHIIILDALLKLRQVCCDPRLLDAAATAGSAKLDALLELLDTLLSEGRSVLVFSQFTSMLALIEEALRARQIDYALLTGDTIDRAAVVARFQRGEVSVFLISLKAGGVGLNLTAADTVIHYDPWWNPASENQATDRAWRIGQDQPVFVYKLIAQGTLEEKIQEMQRRKGELANAVLDAEGGAAAAIGADDLQVLFARTVH
jgi:superfamily II DNA or RNA helicase